VGAGIGVATVVAVGSAETAGVGVALTISAVLPPKVGVGAGASTARAIPTDAMAIPATNAAAKMLVFELNGLNICGSFL
jgi:hypothetical protein